MHISEIVRDLTAWKCLGPIEEVVAQTWIVECAPDAPIHAELTARQAPMKDWDVGRTIIIGASIQGALAIKREKRDLYALYFLQNG